MDDHLRRCLLLGVLTIALDGCAADPKPRVEDADVSADSVGEIEPSDGPIFESEVVITCVATNPRVTPVQPPPLTASCVFDVSPRLPADIGVNVVTGDGVELPREEYELVGGNVLELTGQACADYLAGKIAVVTLQIAC